MKGSVVTMMTIIDEDIETVGDDIIPVSPLDSLSEELLNETIQTQLANPYLATTNCVAEFNEIYEYAKQDIVGEDDAVFVRDTADDFYTRLVFQIDKKYELDIEETLFGELSLENKANIAEALYSFFVTEYAENVTKYFIKVIDTNFDDICDYISNNFTPNVTYNSLVEKVGDSKIAMLLSNIDLLISIVDSYNYSSDRFIELYDIEKFDTAVIAYLIYHGILNGDFVHKFVEPISKRIQDDIYDEMRCAIHTYFYQKYRIKSSNNILDEITVQEGEE